MARHKALIVGTALIASPLLAQGATAPAPYTLAIAAGYKAAMLCSGMFVAGRTQAQIETVELKGIYAEYNAIVPTLFAEVDRGYGEVRVRFSDDLPPRIARYHRGTGCTTDPIGTAPKVAADGDTPPATVAGGDPRPFPLGDALPRGTLPPLAAVDKALAGGFGGVTTGVVVLRGPRLVAERYAEGFGPFTAQRTWSVAKSVTGTLVGIAVKEGVVRVAAPARIPAWADARQGITLDNLLRMASGLHSATAGNRTDAVYFGGTTVTEETVAWPLEVKPGTRFRYANNDILLAMLSLRTALGEVGYRDYPARALFGRIGMKHSVIETDWRGNYISSSQMWTTARDLARFGLLYLNDGMWNGERILPEGWRRYVTSPSGPQPASGFGYGATFWLMNKVPGVPADTFSANGNRGQYVVIVPSRGIVIVRRGEDPGGGGFDIAKFTAAILAELK